MNLTTAQLTLDEAEDIIKGLSKASKMPCATYNLPAKKCKRGSKLHKVENSVCSHCYARKGRFMYPNVQDSMEEHLEAMKHPRWVEAMALVLTYREQSGFFRWMSSGDIQSLADLLKICEVCRRTPHIKHWLPTHEVSILGAFKRAGFQYPDNLTVRLSADMIDVPVSDKLASELGVRAGNVSTKEFDCPASRQNNFCLMCRRCWDKNVPAVTYPLH